MGPPDPMLNGRDSSVFPPALLWRAALAWLALCLLLVMMKAQSIAVWQFPDPDDVMRLVQVRDLLAGQSWFDLTQYRIDSTNGGVPMHWSRLVDLPLALLIGLLSPLIGVSAAETTALVVVPLLTLGAAVLLTMRIAWRLLGDEEAILAAMMMAIAVPVLFQLGPMRIDHHGWQIVCALVAVNGLMAGSAVTGGRVIGAALATWLAISIEGLPLAAAIFAVLALRWLRAPAERVWLRAAIQWLAVVSAGLFVLTRGLGDLAIWCDAISPLHLAMFGWGALVLTVLARAEPVPLAVRLIGFVVAGGGALAILMATAPQCAVGGGFGDLDPLVKQLWHAGVAEGLPIWQQTPAVMLQYAVTPLIGLAGALMLARQASDEPTRAFWFDYALVLGAAYVISLLVARAGAVACILAAPPLAWIVRYWLQRIRTLKQPVVRVAGMLAVACALLPVMPLTALSAAIPQRAALGAMAVPLPGGTKSKCELTRGTQALRALPVGAIYAPLDIAPQILLDTDHTVMATGHHRGNLAMRSVITTAMAQPEAARAALADYRIAYVALCADLAEPHLYAAQAPDGFMAQLIAGKAPAWLEPVPLGPGTALQVWRVRPE